MSPCPCSQHRLSKWEGKAWKAWAQVGIQRATHELLPYPGPKLSAIRAHKAPSRHTCPGPWAWLAANLNKHPVSHCSRPPTAPACPRLHGRQVPRHRCHRCGQGSWRETQTRALSRVQQRLPQDSMRSPLGAPRRVPATPPPRPDAAGQPPAARGQCIKETLS